MRRQIYAALVAIVVSCAVVACQSCYKGNGPDVPEPSPGPNDPDRPPIGDVGCAAACTHLRQLGCVEGQPTPQGAPCETVCANASQSGLGAVNTGCLATVTACSLVASCAR